ncbi:purine nucleoside phosphorylase LACC1 isoform X1 [Hypanus sabinus]|uniref:purine nucleoside phosphorylase LACC1 isoform X1 n=2 Tax=Hypanus sabinus TaxID=79690 RepID=UPI0028C3A59C|nr:purine nucleoside phosphorylase LACC1 isoform X1 [Hypanus sabinus]XP_059823811.1 purine nucleoside phosphorylase LACC1 isoform X1 [Hypanus sabinus]
MVDVVLVDFSDVPYDCLRKCFCHAVGVMSEHSLSSRAQVFLVSSQKNPNIADADIRGCLCQFMKEMAMPKGNLEVLVGSSFAAILYTIKQKIDQESLGTIKAIVSAERKSTLELYIEQLFTMVYKFSFETFVMDGKGEVKLQLPAPSIGERPLARQQADAIRRDIWKFMAQLEGIMGPLVVLKSLLISDLFLHGFTTRNGGISYLPGMSSLNLFNSLKRRDPVAVVNENIQRLARNAGFNAQTFYLAKVSHGNTIWTVGKNEPQSYDGIVTNQKGITIAAPGADCIPLLFADPVQQVCGAAHAGWKGTLAGVATATVDTMVAEFGSSVKDVRVVLGPSVGRCCFMLHREAARGFAAIDPGCVEDPSAARSHVDLRRASRVLLERAGILPENIGDDSPGSRDTKTTLCTVCHPDLFFSYIRDGSNFGTQIGFISVRDHL